MADEDDKEKAGSGMDDLSDVLATGDNETGEQAADLSAAVEQAPTAEPESEQELEIPDFDLDEDSMFSDAESKDIEGFEIGLANDRLVVKLRRLFFPHNSIRQKLFNSSKDFYKKSKALVRQLSTDGKKRAIKFAKEDSLVILDKTKTGLQVRAKRLSAGLTKFGNWSWKLKLMLGLSVVSVLVLFQVAKISMNQDLLKQPDKTYVDDFSEVATEVFKITSDSKWENFRNPMRYPEYIVMFKRIVVVLTPSSFSSKRPMGIFSLFFEASSQDAATELKDREPYVRDRTARTLEQMTYDELRTIEGKRKIKKYLKQELNKVLNQGAIVNVHFKDFVLKP
ncbi:MAG: flagellar basal body-associated FliL family protein [Bdellovibrionales bacterium]